MNTMPLRNSGGFLLAEAVIAISLITIIMALLLPRVLTTTEGKNTASIAKELRLIEGALVHYKAHIGVYPADGLVALWDRDDPDITWLHLSHKDKWRGAYMHIPSMPYRKAGAPPGPCDIATKDYCDPVIPGVSYSFVPVLADGSGGEGNCANSAVMGRNNTAEEGVDLTIKVLNVPAETARIMSVEYGTKICLVDASSTTTTNMYYLFDEF